MGVLDRMGRALSARFDALLDGLEDPRKSVEQTLREMEAALAESMNEVVRAVAAERQLRDKIERLDADVEKWNRRAELALRRADEELARDALRQRRRIQQERERAERFRVEQRSYALELKRERERMAAKLEELKAKRGTLVARAVAERAGGGVEGLGAPASGGAFRAFEAIEERIEGAELAVQAHREVEAALADVGPGGLTGDRVEARFRELEGAAGDGAESEDIEAELNQLKRRVRVQSS